MFSSVHHSATTLRMPNLDFSNREFQLMGLKFGFPSFSYFGVVYRSTNSADSFVFGLLSSSIECLLIADSRSHITELGDFNVHSREGLVHSSDASAMGPEAEQFAAVNSLSQLTDLPTCIPDRAGDPCSYSRSYPSFRLFSMLKYLYVSSSWFIGPLYNWIIRHVHTPQPPILFKIHFGSAI